MEKFDPRTFSVYAKIKWFQGKKKIRQEKRIGVREARTLDLRITQKLWDLRASQLRHHPDV